MTIAALLAAAVAGGAPWTVVVPAAGVVWAPLPTAAALGWLALRGRRESGSDTDVDVLAALAGELRAGRSLRAALWSGFGTDPTTSTGRVGRRARLGLPMTEVVEGVADAFGRHGALVAASIRLVDRRGGSAVDALDTVAILVRDDRDLARELAAAVAPARLSAVVVGLAPLLFLGWQASDGALARALAVPGGAVMLLVGIGLVVVGTVVVFRLSRPLR